MIMSVDTITKIVTLKALLISSLAMPFPYLRLINF